MSATEFVIVCDDYRSPGRQTRAQAEALLASIEKLGVCHADHKIEEVEA